MSQHAEHPQPIAISQFELGIGDIICSLYALYGFSRARNFPPVKLYMRDHVEWPPLVDIRNLEVARVDGDADLRVDYALGDGEEDYRRKLAAGTPPKQWYARKLDCQPARPPLSSAVLDSEPPFPQPYIVLSPFATRINRTWEVHNWRIVARELTAAGFTVIALDAPHQPDRCREVGVEYFWGQPPLWVARACLHASLIIAGDSALAHLGGLVGTRTLVVLSQQNPHAYFSLTHNAYIRPNQPCVECRFQPERGYEEKCDFGCWTLQSISPKAVIAKALDMVGRVAPAP